MNVGILINFNLRESKLLVGEDKVKSLVDARLFTLIPFVDLVTDPSGPFVIFISDGFFQKLIELVKAEIL